MGLNIAVRALLAQRRAMDVTSHNIANADTKGYSRQRAELVTTNPYTYPSMYGGTHNGQVGTGVEVEAIIRIRDSLVDSRFRDEASLLGETTHQSNTLQEIELIFGEPSDSGLRSSLDAFWKSVQELSSNAGEEDYRRPVRVSAIGMCDLLNTLNFQLKDFRKSLDGYLGGKITAVNAHAKKIADLNKQISQIIGNNENPNDLMDKRDLLLDELSQLADIQVNYDSRGRANVTIGGCSLVMGTTFDQLEYTSDNQNKGMGKIVWAGTSKKVTFSGGEIAGILESRDTIVPKYIEELDTMARTFINDFNKVHQAGYGLDNSTNIKFFEGADAATIRVSEQIMDEVHGLNRIAAAIQPTSSGSLADGRNAIRLGQVMQIGASGNKVTMGDYWGGLISGLAIESERSQKMFDNQNTLLQQIETQRQSISGVMGDEEYANLVRFQQAWNSAAKLLKVQEELLDTLINGII